MTPTPNTVQAGKMPSRLFIERNVYGHYDVHRGDPRPSGFFKVGSTVAEYVRAADRPAPAMGVGWQPIETAPDECIIAAISGDKLWWAQAAKRGKGALRSLWYTLAGGSLGVPTHWIATPLAATQAPAQAERPPCSNCGGMGSVEPALETCGSCNGSGKSTQAPAQEKENGNTTTETGPVCSLAEEAQVWATLDAARAIHAEDAGESVVPFHD